MAYSKGNNTNSNYVDRKVAVKLTKEEQNKIIPMIQDFFRQERNEEIDIIASMTILDFFLENIGIFIYNKSLDEAKMWLTKKLEDVEIDFDMLYK